MWAMAPRNTILAAKSRDAVQKVLMKKWNDVELEQVTVAFARRIFSESPEPKEMKVKAASILVYLLQWGGDHGYCQRPAFTYDELTGGDATGVDTIKVREMAKVTELDIRRLESDVTPVPCDEHGNALEGCSKTLEDMIEIVYMEDKPKENTDMDKKEKKPRGRAPRQVAQIDPGTLEVIKVWPAIADAERETGASDIYNAVKKQRKSAGFYWSNAEDAGTFRDRLAEKQLQHENGKKPAADPGQEPAPKPESRSQCASAAQQALAVFSDDELLEELDRRGWQGNLRRTQVVTIGAKEG